MPEGIEKDIPPAEMADLLAFIRTSAPAARAKTFPGNKPEVIRPDYDNALHLTATNCEIYGKTLSLEARYANLGSWMSSDDQARWTVELPKAAKYTLWLTYSCPAASAGNAFVIEAGPAKLAGEVSKTETWDSYRRERLGDLQLSAGRQQIRIRPQGSLRGPLMNLKEIRLVPKG